MTACPHNFQRGTIEGPLRSLHDMEVCTLCHHMSYQSIVKLIDEGWNIDLGQQGVVSLAGPYPPLWWSVRGGLFRPMFSFQLDVSLDDLDDAGQDMLSDAIHRRLTVAGETRLAFRSNN